MTSLEEVLGKCSDKSCTNVRSYIHGKAAVKARRQSARQSTERLAGKSAGKAVGKTAEGC